MINYLYVMQINNCKDKVSHATQLNLKICMLLYALFFNTIQTILPPQERNHIKIIIIHCQIYHDHIRQSLYYN